MLLTKGRNDGTCDAVGHGDCKDAHGPGVLQAKLELVGLTLQIQQQQKETRNHSELFQFQIKAHVKALTLARKAPLTRLT